MTFFRRIKGAFTVRSSGPGAETVHVGNPMFDEWEAVRDYEDQETARAFLQSLREHGVDAVLTSDWPLDQFGRGDIALRVRSEDWSEAEEFFSGLDLP